MTRVGRQPLRPRHIPQRTCIGCGQKRAKQELTRIVHTPADILEIDDTGKKAGRGAYLCKLRACWELGLKKNRLEYVLRTGVSQESKTRLLGYSEALPILGKD